MTKKNIYNTLESITDYFSPKIISEVDHSYVKLAKIKGEDLPWHAHEKEDECFIIISGKLKMEIENQDAIILERGDVYLVPKGIVHRVSAENECHIMLIEAKTTKHTGELIYDITKSIEEQK